MVLCCVILLDVVRTRYAGGDLYHLPVKGRSATESTLYWQRSLAKAPSHGDLATKSYRHRLQTMQARVCSKCNLYFTDLWRAGFHFVARRLSIDTPIKPRQQHLTPVSGQQDDNTKSTTEKCRVLYNRHSIIRGQNTQCGLEIFRMPVPSDSLLGSSPQPCPRTDGTTRAVGSRSSILSARIRKAYPFNCLTFLRIPVCSFVNARQRASEQLNRIDPRQRHVGPDKLLLVSYHTHTTTSRRHRQK